MDSQGLDSTAIKAAFPAGMTKGSSADCLNTEEEEATLGNSEIVLTIKG